MQRLEATLARIEALLKGVNDRLRKVEIELAEVKERVTNLPSTWAMITTMPGGQIALAAAILPMSRIVGAH